MSTWASIPNFGFLFSAGTILVRTAAAAERNFPDDPVTNLMKLRQFGEALAQRVVARTGVFTLADEPQTDLLGRPHRENPAGESASACRAPGLPSDRLPF